MSEIRAKCLDNGYLRVIIPEIRTFNPKTRHFIRIEGVIVTQTYLTTEELSERIKYDVRTIRERLKDSVLLEGVHYLRPFGGRKILFIWETIEKDMRQASLYGL